ncbi:TIGR03085 family metal-binding protein [Corynebacterium silvaticum]|uniref:TIGR03085 family metal-binding protein n=2 Tax=Corynebacterium silvaticum TaxID=2320431 RepID=A0A7U5HM57_9CORY|nr:TIGR03085 family metal-binding protein [Corynebacterium silvaticum]ARU46337.2 TIGR03085 family metal-binding protein [Corynebacterium silvaticum]
MLFVEQERLALAELLLEKGAEAPTLCEGWNTEDLAVHLYVRQRYPLATAGMFVPALSPLLKRRTQETASMPFTEIVEAWTEEKRGFSRSKTLDFFLNTAEHFVHHEDLRRGASLGEDSLGHGVQPRSLSDTAEKDLLRLLRLFAPKLLRKSSVPVVLEPDRYPRIVVADSWGVVSSGSAVTHIRGGVGELVLWAFGRDAVDIDVCRDIGKVVRSGL